MAHNGNLVNSEPLRKLYGMRRDVMEQALRAQFGDRLTWNQPKGGFFLWAKLPEGLTAERLLAEERVAVAPGEGFGPSGAGWARLSLAVTDETIELGAERLHRAFAAVTA